MGHLANAKGFRVGKSLPWDFTTHRFGFDKLLYPFIFNGVQNYLKSKFIKYLRAAVFGLIFSHLEIRNFWKKTYIKIHVFNAFFDIYVRRFKYFLKFHRKNRQMPKRKKHLKYLLESSLYYWLPSQKWDKNHRKIRKGSYKLLAIYLTRRLNYDLRNISLYTAETVKNILVVFSHKKYSNVSSSILSEYVIRRFRLNYSLNRVVYPLLKEAKRNKSFKGLFFKFKGRLTRKPRVIVNKKIFKFGKIGFSTLTTNVDYSFKRFETRFGTCSIKIWICHY